MLSAPDLLLVVATTAVCTGVVTALALLGLRLIRRRSIASQFAIIVVASALSIIVSTIAVVKWMFFSEHELVIVAWVVGVSGLMTLGAALLMGRIARASAARLVASAQRLGDGAVVEAGVPSWREFDDLARQLVDSSARLAAARAEIERMDAARRQFFAWISHDLRTPLAGMRAMAEALEDGRASDPAGYVRQMRAKVDTVDRMVDDLFELSRLQSDAVRPAREPVDLLDVVSDAVADVRFLAANRGIRIVQEGIAGCVIDADPRELARVVGNLLSNAVRHAPDDSEVLVSGRLDGDAVTLAVVDRGTGVPDADLVRMFDVGWRGDPARAIDGASGAGAGLGLAIVRELVEAHGGSVRAAHRAEGFYVELTLPAGAGHRL